MTELMPGPPDDGREEESEQSTSDKDFDKQTKKDFSAAATNKWHNIWRKQGAEDFEFVAGGSYDDSGQWLKADIERLKSQERPIITMNRLEPLVEGIVGAEVNNRQSVSFEPRETADKDVATALMEVAQWARDNDVEEEETDAFRSALICGMGWLNHRMDYSEDLDGKYAVVATDALGHYWDVDSSRPNLSDARWVGYVEVMSKDKFKVTFPDQPGADNVFGFKGDEPGGDHPAKYNTDYDDPNLMNVEGWDTPSDVHVLEFQCYKMEPVYRILKPGTEELSPPVDKDEFAQMRAMAEAAGAMMVRFGTPVDPPEDGSPMPPVFQYLQQEKRVYYRAFYSGNKRLEPVERNPWRNGFTMQCITGRRHRMRKTWYGMVRAMKDPQRLTNSFLSAMIHHYNSNPKGGLEYEEGAVENPTTLEKKLAHPSPVIEYLPGGLAKTRRIEPAAPSPALGQLMQIVSDMPPLVTGVSLEWLGLASRDQPVGLEQTRKLATLSIVAPIFSSYRKYKKNAGRLLFDYVKDYIPESTLTRVVSEASRQFIPALKDADTLKYDVHVDDAPLSPSVKATVYSGMKDIMQFAGTMMPPGVAMEVAKAFFNYSPLPADLVREINKAMQPPPPDPLAMLAKLGELKKLFAEGQEIESKAELNDARAVTEGYKPEQDRDRLMFDFIDSAANIFQAQIQANSKKQTSNGAAK